MKFHQLFQCLYCKEQFDSKEDILKHQGICSEKTCKECEKVFLTCKLGKHLQVHTNEKLLNVKHALKAF